MLQSSILTIPFLLCHSLCPHGPVLPYDDLSHQSFLVGLPSFPGFNFRPDLERSFRPSDFTDIILPVSPLIILDSSLSTRLSSVQNMKSVPYLVSPTSQNSPCTRPMTSHFLKRGHLKPEPQLSTRKLHNARERRRACHGLVESDVPETGFWDIGPRDSS